MYTSLENYYRTSWAMSYYYKYSLSEINDMIPFERDLYVALTNQKQQEQAAEQQEN